MTLLFGFSPCPNDTFAFDALVHAKINTPFSITPRLHDINELNDLALRGHYPITKVSAYCLGKITKEYCLLSAGAAVGHNVGPKLVAKRPCDITQATIAVPGKHTTANLLVELLLPPSKKILFLPYHEIVPSILSGKCDAGVIIHETRFTFAQQGLIELYDLGDLYTKQYHPLLPLGVIVAKRSLGKERLHDLSQALCHSVEFAFNNPLVSRDYVLDSSQEKDIAVVQKHIDLYVNKESKQLSKQAMNSITILLQAAIERKLLCPSALEFI